MAISKVRKFGGKKFALLGVAPTKARAGAKTVKKYGYTRIVKVKGGYAVYFRSHTATN